MSKFPFFIAIAAAILAMGYFVFATDAAAYGGSAPETCANCHVMDDNFAVYYAEKGRQGAKDTYAFITGNIPAAIRANEKTKGIIQENCIHCHEDTAETVVMGAQPFDRYCWDCHRSVAHGTRGASNIPYQDSTLYPIK
jgi:cytochrome c nitrite reductase small subunit